MIGSSNEGCRAVKCRQQDGNMGNAKQHVFKEWKECKGGRQTCLHFKKLGEQACFKALPICDLNFFKLSFVY